MNTLEFMTARDDLNARCETILGIKGQAYGQEAVSKDRLGNFKRTATFAGITPLQVALTFLLKHFDSVQSWIREASLAIQAGERIPDEVGGEPIEDRIADIRNYIDLLYSIYVDLKPESDAFGADMVINRDTLDVLERRNNPAMYVPIKIGGDHGDFIPAATSMPATHLTEIS